MKENKVFLNEKDKKTLTTIFNAFIEYRDSCIKSIDTDLEPRSLAFYYYEEGLALELAEKLNLIETIYDVEETKDSIETCKKEFANEYKLVDEYYKKEFKSDDKL